MTITTRPTVFISYASADLALAEAVHRRLTAAGLSVWFDKARLRPGFEWHKEIEAGCEASRLVLPVLTPRWKESEWTKFETYGAEATIPLIFEGTFEDIFTPPLTRFQGQAIDLTQADEPAWERLLAAIRELLARPAPDKLARLAEVRYAANPYFVGRESDLIRIHEALHENPTAVLTQGRVRAITALGGIGKTTLARQYVEKFWRCYPQIFWADCRLGVETEFARLCELFFPETRAETNVVQKARLALRELQTRSDRLLILDNAEDEASIQAWIPKTGHCRTLITSRFAGWSAVVKSFHLYVLDPEPARTLLATRADRGDFAQLTPAEQTACEALAKELGYLPLALEQAAAYIWQQGLEFSFADYLRLYGAATAELLDEGVLGSNEYPDSVMTTWTTTLRKLDPTPKAILRLYAFLAPTPLPLTVLYGGSQVLLDEAETVAGSPVTPPGHIETWVRKQVKQLQNYSMVEVAGHSISLHPLVQTVQRLNLSTCPGEHRATLERSLDWIDAAFVEEPQDVRSWPTLNPLVPHATAIVQHADEAGIADPTGRLMNDLAVLSLIKAQYGEAEPLMRRCLVIDEQSYGVDHTVVAIRLNNLATLLKETNRLVEAESLMRRALTIHEQSFGAEHTEVGQFLNNLAALLLDANRLAEAEPLMRRAVAIDEQTYDAEHPSIARRLSNLALLLLATNRLAEAEPLIRRAIAIDEQFYGTEHPNVANGLSILAALLTETNRQSESESLMRRALAIHEQSFGVEHPDVACDLNNLAVMLLNMNRPTEAEPLIRRALTIDEQTYGSGHPRVGRDLHNLARLLQETNRFVEAEPLMRSALSPFLDFTRSTGREHPHLQAAFGNYAALLKAMGRSQSDVDAALQSLMAE